MISDLVVESQRFSGGVRVKGKGDEGCWAVVDGGDGGRR